MGKRTSRFINLEAESEDEEIESSIISEDFDDFKPVEIEKSYVRSHKDFTKELEERYGDIDEEEEESGVEEVVEALPQTSLVPNNHSPLLFLVRCKAGKEKDICMKLSEHLEGREVFSIVQKEGLKGYIYVEAFKKQEVEDLLANVRFVYRNRLSVVPIKEMIEAISQERDVVISEFARVKGGKYRGDIVQVLETFEHAVKIKAVPRIDDIRRRFEPSEHRGKVVKKDGGFYYNRDFYKDGYLVKSVLKKSLDFDAEPTFKDLKDLGLNRSFSENDVVEIQRGELKSVIGNIVRILGEIAVISANGREYEVAIDDIEKHYNVGDEVSYRGTNGVILKIENNRAIIAIENFTEEKSCFIWELEKPVQIKRCVPNVVRPLRNCRDPMINKLVDIKDGKYKGYGGIVKDVYRNKCRVQLNINSRCVLIDKSSLILINENRNLINENLNFKRNKIYRDSINQISNERVFDKNAGVLRNKINTIDFKDTPTHSEYKTPGYKTPGFMTPGLNSPGISELNNSNQFMRYGNCEYKGTLITAGGKTVVVSNFKDGLFYDDNGNTYASDEVSFVAPMKYDQVVVLKGPYIGTSGVLIDIENSVGIVRTNNNLSHKVKLSELSKKS